MLGLKLTDMDGEDILKKIKESEATKNIPLFVFSNKGPEDLPEFPNPNLAQQDKFILHATLKIDQLIEMVKETLR
jgi:response regulator RpfG family c-di-GMP phosphodiesterase